MEYIEIVNWEEYQHYKKRNPPWIKLHNTLLENYDIMRLDPRDRWLAIGLMLLASRTGNRIPADREFLLNRLWVDDLSGLVNLVSVGFITMSRDAGAALACRTQVVTLSRGETEAETEAEERNNTASFHSAGAGALTGKSIADCEPVPPPTCPSLPNGTQTSNPASWVMPLIRTHLRPAGSSLPERWSDDQEVETARVLLAHESQAHLELACVGFAHLRDLGELEFLVKPGEAATLLVFSRRSDPDSVWNQSLHHALKFGLTP